MNKECPSAETLTRYVNAVLLEAEAVAIDDHLDGCASCEDTVSLLERSEHELIRKAAISTRSLRSRRSPNMTTRDFLLSLEPDDIIVDCRLVKELGSGAFARVFLAQQRSMQRFVAVKFSSKASHEPKLLSQLNHRHIVKLYHYDDRALSDSGIHMLYMQYVSGCSLKELVELLNSAPASELDGDKILKAIHCIASTKSYSDATSQASLNSPLAQRSWPETVNWIGARLADALDCAHKQGVVHRDVKPANILLTTDGSPMLLDFNVGFGATIDGAEPEDDFGGSQSYMSPEQEEAFRQQSSAHSVTASSDIYSLGVVLLELAAEWKVHAADTIERSTSDPDPAQDSPMERSFPDAFPSVLDQCLARDPAERPDSAGIVARQLHLANHPAVRELTTFRRNGWRHWMSTYPFAGACLALSIAGLVPNLQNIYLSDLFDSYTNLLDASVLKLAKIRFNFVVLPLGFSILFGVSWPVMKGCQRVMSGEKLTDWQNLVRRGIALGQWYSAVTFAGWTIAGATYPIIDYSFGPDVKTTPEYLAYFGYHLMLGLEAGALVFLLVSLIATRFLLPLFILGEGSMETRRRLNQILTLLDRQSAILGTVPLTALVIIAASGHSSENDNIFMALGIIGLLGFGLAIYLAPIIRANIGTLGVMLLSNKELLYGEHDGSSR